MRTRVTLDDSKGVPHEYDVWQLPDGAGGVKRWAYKRLDRETAYVVTLTPPPGTPDCTCPDFVFRRKRETAELCKHLGHALDGTGMTTLDHARGYLAAGLSVIPIAADGSKAPLLASWKPYTARLPDAGELLRWWGPGQTAGVAVIGGLVSGGLEILDLDRSDILDEYAAFLAEESPALYDRLPRVRTPAGWHLYFRSACPQGNQKLAQEAGPDGRLKTLAETRGEGGYVLAPGCPPACHPTGGLYELVHGSLTAIPVLTADERQLVLDAARALNRWVPSDPPPPPPPPRPGAGPAPQANGHAGGGHDDGSPGNDFSHKINVRGFEEMLQRAGWVLMRRVDAEVSRWRRPGKDEKGHSATLGLRSKSGRVLLHVFSSNAPPFDQGGNYDAFGFYAREFHGGNFEAAADALQADGYGTPKAGEGPNVRFGQKPGTEEAAPDVKIPNDADIPLPDPEPWPAPPDPAVYSGLAGEIVQRIEPETEADAVGILVQFLAMFGNIIGRTAYWRVENNRHYGNLYCCLVGDTAVGRKGTSFGRALGAFSLIEGDAWAQKRIVSGMSSGEGLIWAVRDETVKEGDVVDSGEHDKRLLVVEPEFAQPLKMMRREGNTLSTVIRQGWDSGNLATLTKNNRTRASNAHVSILGHITRQELAGELAAVESANGFANRFLWTAVRRSKLLPFGGKTVSMSGQAYALMDAIKVATLAGEVGLTREAKRLFDEGGMYRDLNALPKTTAAAVLSRGAAQVRRLAMLYALLDCREEVDAPDLVAAKALWDYCTRSVRWIFGESVGDRLADELLQALQSVGSAGMTQTEISNYFGRHERAVRIGQALAALLQAGKVRCEAIPTSGRPTKKWYAVCEKSEKSAGSCGATS